MEITSANRVIINTIAMYIRTILNALLALYSTRLILRELGESDYGIYMLVGGVVSMLSFITNALIGTTQRYLSFFQGKKDKGELIQIFNNSLILHSILAILSAALLTIAGFFILDDVLNIPINRISAAKVVYASVVVSLMISFIASPYKALLISHENIIYVSIIDVIDGILKVAVAILLTFISFDKLSLYGILTASISLFNLAAYAIYDYIKYEECTWPRFSNFDISYFKKLISFAWWSMYSAFCVTWRTQGVAIILNQFYGTVVNSAFGLAQQVTGVFYNVSSALDSASSPQIVKSEGNGNRKHMLRLSEITSKFCFLLISMIGIPCIFEMEQLLKIWLSDVPENAVFFCQAVLLSTILDQTTIGLGTANRAIGDIGRYSLTVNTLKLLTLPLAVLSLFLGFDFHAVMYIYVIVEFSCAMSRLYYLHKSGGLSIREFVYKVFLKEITPIVLTILSVLIVVIFTKSSFRFFITFPVSIIVLSISSYCVGLCDDEKDVIDSFLRINK